MEDSTKYFQSYFFSGFEKRGGEAFYRKRDLYHPERIYDILTGWIFSYFDYFLLQAESQKIWSQMRLYFYLLGHQMLMKDLIFYRRQNWEKIVRPRVKFCPPTGPCPPTGTSPNWHFPQLALFWTFFFVPLRIWVPQLPVHRRDWPKKAGSVL